MRVLVLLSLLIAAPVWAGELSEVVSDYSTVESTVVDIRSGGSLQLIGDGRVKTGDLFFVSADGEPIYHPKTNELLGHREVSRGYVKVTKAGGSLIVAEPKDGLVDDFALNDRAVRNAGLKAFFFSVDTSGFDTYSKLKSQLPGLNWQPYYQGGYAQLPERGENDLLFQYDQGEVTVTGYQLNPVYGKYQLMDKPRVVKEAHLLKPAKFWQGGGASGRAVSLAMTKTDDGYLLAQFNEDRLVLSQWVDGGFVEVASYEYDAGLRCVYGDTFDLDNDGSEELIVSAVRDGVAHSFALSYIGGSFTTVVEDSPYLLRVDDSESELLIGQLVTKKTAGFAKRLQVLNFVDGELEVESELPEGKHFDLTGWLPTRIDNESVYIALSGEDNLRVVETDGEVRWKTDGVYGGALKYIVIPDPDGRGSDDFTVRQYLKSRIVELPGAGYVLPKNEGSRSFPNSTNFTKSSLVMLGWNGLSFEEMWQTPVVNSYLADFQIFDIDGDGQSEVITVNNVGGSWFKGSKYQLTVYRLQ